MAAAETAKAAGNKAMSVLKSKWLWIPLLCVTCASAVAAPATAAAAFNAVSPAQGLGSAFVESVKLVPKIIAGGGGPALQATAHSLAFGAEHLADASTWLAEKTTDTAANITTKTAMAAPDLVPFNALEAANSAEYTPVMAA